MTYRASCRTAQRSRYSYVICFFFLQSCFSCVPVIPPLLHVLFLYCSLFEHLVQGRLLSRVPSIALRPHGLSGSLLLLQHDSALLPFSRHVEVDVLYLLRLKLRLRGDCVGLRRDGTGVEIVIGGRFRSGLCLLRGRDCVLFRLCL